MILKAQVLDGRLMFESTNMLQNRLLPLEKQEVVVSIKKWTNNRSNQQNKFLWLYYRLIEKETGNKSKDIHDYAKRKFLKPIKRKVFDKEFYIVNSTTKLNTKEFNAFIRDIEEWTGIIALDEAKLNQLEEYL